MTVKEQVARHQHHGHSAWLKEPTLPSGTIRKSRKSGAKVASKTTKQAAPKRPKPPVDIFVSAHPVGVGDALLNRLFFGKTNSHWRPANAGYEYARWQLEQLVDGDYAPDAVTPNSMALARMAHYLRSLLVPGTLYPTLSVDEDGDVTAEWRVVDYGLEFVTTEEDAYWVLRKGGDRQITSEDISGLRSVLSALTIRADEVNPAWRSLFPKADVQNR